MDDISPAFAGELPISFAVPGAPRHIAVAGPGAMEMLGLGALDLPQK